jgi:hypothetical protein
MSADASTLPDGPMNLRLRRISPGLALRHALLVARRNLLQVRGNPQLVIFVLIQPICSCCCSCTSSAGPSPAPAASTSSS